MLAHQSITENVQPQVLHNHMTKQFLSGKKVIVIGAGLVGTIAAIMLSRHGAQVQIIERQQTNSNSAFSNRRSFNITVSSRGQAALEAAGIWEEVRACTIPITGRMCHMGEKMSAFPYSRDNSVALFGARRSDVNTALLDTARQIPSVSILFGHKLVDLDKQSGSIDIEDINTNERVTISDADFVIGADGVYSTMRRLIHTGERVDFTQSFLDWGYREIHIPAPAAAGNSQHSTKWFMPENYLHVWPRGDLMMFALPNPDGSFTGNFIYPIERESDFHVAGRMTEIFRREFPDVFALVPEVESQLSKTPVSYFPTQRNSKWSLSDKFVLLGDAAHATVPFYGQGMNSSFESVMELMSCLEEFGALHRDEAFCQYQENRKPHTDAVADLSIENFDELRSNFRHLIPQARRRIDVLLNRLFPESYKPLHVLISHSQINYRTAIDMCAKRDRLLRCFGMDLVIGLFAGAQILTDACTKLISTSRKSNSIQEHTAST